MTDVLIKTKSVILSELIAEKFLILFHKYIQLEISYAIYEGSVLKVLKIELRVSTAVNIIVATSHNTIFQTLVYSRACLTRNVTNGTLQYLGRFISTVQIEV